MPAAADIQEAIDLVVVNLSSPNVLPDYQKWLANMFTPAGFNALAVGSAQFWDAKNSEQRTVFDWVIPTLITNRKINAQGASVLSNNLAIDVVLRTLLGVQAATDKNRITQDQEDTVVEAYNDAFA